MTTAEPPEMDSTTLFPEAADPFDRLAGQALGERFKSGPDGNGPEAAAAAFHRLDLPPLDVRADSADHRLNFRQFRHVAFDPSAHFPLRPAKREISPSPKSLGGLPDPSFASLRDALKSVSSDK